VFYVNLILTVKDVIKQVNVLFAKVILHSIQALLQVVV
jgi:hypothetical protein